MRPIVIAISGIKNAGKTTLIEEMLPYFVEEGFHVAVIKHDGHTFEADTSGSDSYRHKKAGAVTSLVYDQEKCLMVKDVSHPRVETFFPYVMDMDFVIFEGGKDSAYPKIEVIRKEHSSGSVCKKHTILSYYTDLEISGTRCIPLGDVKQVADVIMDYVKGVQNER